VLDTGFGETCGNCVNGHVLFPLRLVWTVLVSCGLWYRFCNVMPFTFLYVHGVLCAHFPMQTFSAD
jgi:hypothetical protein